jgi:hypothetical protein
VAGVDDWDQVRDALVAEGLPAEDFGRFTSGRHPEGIPLEHFDYEKSVPVLLAVLPDLSDPEVIEATVRSLSTKYAKPAAAPALIKLFRETPADEAALKWAIGNALNTVCDRSHTEPLTEFAKDEGHGLGRQMIVLRLGYFRDDEGVTKVLLSLLDDPEVALHAMSALRTQIGPEEARGHIAALVEAESPQVSQAATRELRKIDKQLAAGQGGRS